MRLGLLLASLLLAACPAEPRRAEPPPPELRAQIDRVADDARAAGLPVERIEYLRSRRELPGCPEARFRFRLHFVGADERFVNVSRFETPAEARACLDDFKATALKAGPTGWERLAPTIAARGPWLYLFPQDLHDAAFRRQVIEALPDDDQ